MAEVMSLAWAVVGRRAEDRRTAWASRLAAALQVWHRRIRARQALAMVDRRTLEDAGIDHLAAQFEAAQPFWIAERRLR